jgi:hypothetical protein
MKAILHGISLAAVLPSTALSGFGRWSVLYTMCAASRVPVPYSQGAAIDFPCAG